MNKMFTFERSSSPFNGDISKWDVSRVTNMEEMFYYASEFNGDLTKWDVSRVTTMRSMFYGARSFTQTLCERAWVQSTADKFEMFHGSPGSIGLSTDLCIPNWWSIIFVLITIGVVALVVVRVSVSGRKVLARQRHKREREHARYRRECETEAYQHEVRRQWLRGIHALTGGKDGVYDFPRTSSNGRVVSRDPHVSQLLDFFSTYKGLLRPIGATITLYHSPSSAYAFPSRGRNQEKQVR